MEGALARCLRSTQRLWEPAQTVRQPSGGCGGGLGLRWDRGAPAWPAVEEEEAAPGRPVSQRGGAGASWHRVKSTARRRRIQLASPEPEGEGSGRLRPERTPLPRGRLPQSLRSAQRLPWTQTLRPNSRGPALLSPLSASLALSSLAPKPTVQAKRGRTFPDPLCPTTSTVSPEEAGVTGQIHCVAAVPCQRQSPPAPAPGVQATAASFLSPPKGDQRSLPRAQWGGRTV